MKRILFFVACCAFTNAFAGLTDGLVAYYTFDGSAKDLSGWSNDLAVIGATLAPDRYGRTNAAYYFNGSNAWMVSQRVLPISNSIPRTISVWVRDEAPGVYLGYPDIIGFGAMAHTGDLFDIRLIPPAKRLYLHSHYQSSTSVTNAYSDNSWLHVVMSTSGSVDTLNMFVNGVKVASTPDYSPTALYSTTPGKLRLSTWTEAGEIVHSSTDWWREGFKGWIDDVRIYNRALTPQEVVQLYSIESQTPSLLVETAAVRLRFETITNILYSVQWSYDFQSWSNLTTIVGSGHETNLLDWTDGTRKFYRLTIEP